MQFKKKLQKASYFNIQQVIKEGGHNIMNTCMNALQYNTLWSLLCHIDIASESCWFDSMVIFEAVVCGDAAFDSTYC